MLLANVYPPDETATFVEEQAAAEVLRKAREDYDAAKASANEAQLAFQEAEKDLNEAYQIMSELRSDQLRIWNEFENFRARKLSEISALRDKIREMDIERRQLEQERNSKSTKNNRAIRASLAKLEKASEEIALKMSGCYDELQREHAIAQKNCDFEEMQNYREKKNIFCMRKLEFELASRHLETLKAALKAAEASYADFSAAHPSLSACNSHS